MTGSITALTGRRAVRLPLALAAVAAVVAVTIGIVFVAGMRTGSPQVQRAVRRVNRAFWNPRSMETAGTEGAYASVVHHVGRRSGAAYHTPVVPISTDDGFVVALPYGSRADWVQNVLAAGQATITHEGVTESVDRPEVVPMADEERWFARRERQAHRLLNVDTCLRLHRVDRTGAPSAVAVTPNGADSTGP